MTYVKTNKLNHSSLIMLIFSPKNVINMVKCMVEINVFSIIKKSHISF